MKDWENGNHPGLAGTILDGLPGTYRRCGKPILADWQTAFNCSITRTMTRSFVLGNNVRTVFVRPQDYGYLLQLKKVSFFLLRCFQKWFRGWPKGSQTISTENATERNLGMVSSPINFTLHGNSGAFLKHNKNTSLRVSGSTGPSKISFTLLHLYTQPTFYPVQRLDCRLPVNLMFIPNA